MGQDDSAWKHQPPSLRRMTLNNPSRQHLPALLLDKFTVTNLRQQVATWADSKLPQRDG